MKKSVLALMTLAFITLSSGAQTIAKGYPYSLNDK